MKNRQAAGFSVIELLTVVTIILILSAMTFPFIMRFMRNYQIQGGAQQVTSEIQSARTKAIMRNVRRAALFVVLPDANPANPPSRYQWVMPDQVRPAAGWRNLGDLMLDPAQVGPIGILPMGLQFATTGTTGLVAFTQLGAQCNPATTACGNPPVDPTGAVLCDNCVTFDAATGQATVTVLQPVTGLQRTVTVLAGGRVLGQ